MLYMIYMVKDDQEMKGKPKMAKKKPEKKSRKNELVRVPNDEERFIALARSLYADTMRKEHDAFWARARLGAVLMRWEMFLGEARGGVGGTSGEGLKGWLEKNLPELGYVTAQSYKESAKLAVKMLGGGAVAMAALLDEKHVVQPDGEVIDVPSEVIEQRDKLFENVDSRRKLEQAYFAFMYADGGKGRAGRPKGSKAVESAPLTKVESARRLWADLVYQAVKHRAGLYSAAKLLPRDDADKSYGELKALCDALKARLDEKD